MENEGALKGIRVIEMGQLIAGPFCGQLLGDMGAEVIKIEPPGDGDPMRQWGQGDDKVNWEVISRNKKSVSINLRVAAGQDLARRLISTADILVENFKAGTLEKWGLAPDTLHADNPRLIIARMSGYGQTGPYADRAGFGGVGEAMGGWRYIVGEPDRPPSRMGISIGDTLTATYGCMGVLAALHARETSGKGQIVDTALYEAVLQVMESMIPEYDRSGIIRERTGSILPGIAPSNVYPCADGQFMIGGNNDTIFKRLCAAMGTPRLADDPRYQTHRARGANQTELDALISAWTVQHSMAEIDALMVAHSIPAGRVYRAPDMLADPHFAAREAITSVDTERFGPLQMQNVVPRLSSTPSSIRSPAPSIVGQHNGPVFRDILGLDEAAVAHLATQGAI
jgi:crotonobetainyl-CoA:carnitine CoA-transferase CaiB-like acyl-CoA transferase